MTESASRRDFLHTLCTITKLLDRVTLWFRHIKLYQSAGVDVENHRRSSMTICETGLPLTTTEREPPLGLPPFHDPIPFRLNSLASCASE